MMHQRQEGDIVNEGWQFTDCSPNGRIHVIYREGNMILRVAFKKEDAADPNKWYTEVVNKADL